MHSVIMSGRGKGKLEEHSSGKGIEALCRRWHVERLGGPATNKICGGL